MEITEIPQSLDISSSQGIQIYTYRSNHNNQRSKIKLTKNAISFLQAGTKEVIYQDKITLVDNKNAH